MSVTSEERLRRWRLVLGRDAEATAAAGGLTGTDAGMDAVLEALYGAGRENERSSKRSAGLGPSSPNVNRWLGDIRTYFPSSVVRVLQNLRATAEAAPELASDEEAPPAPIETNPTSVDSAAQ